MLCHSPQCYHCLLRQFSNASTMPIPDIGVQFVDYLFIFAPVFFNNCLKTRPLCPALQWSSSQTSQLRWQQGRLRIERSRVQTPLDPIRLVQVEAILSTSTHGNKYPRRHIMHMSIKHALGIWSLSYHISSFNHIICSANCLVYIACKIRRWLVNFCQNGKDCYWNSLLALYPGGFPRRYPLAVKLLENRLYIHFNLYSPTFFTRWLEWLSNLIGELCLWIP